MRRFAAGIAVFSIATGALVHCAATQTPDDNQRKVEELERRLTALESSCDAGAVSPVRAFDSGDQRQYGPGRVAPIPSWSWQGDSPAVQDFRDPIDSGSFESLAPTGFPGPDFPQKTIAACLKQGDDPAWSKGATNAAQTDLTFIAAHHMTAAFQVTRLSCRASCCVFSLHWDHPADAGGKIFEHVTNCMARVRTIQKNGDEDLLTDCAGARQIGAVVKPALVDRGKGQNGGVWTYTPWDGSDGGIFPFRSP